MNFLIVTHGHLASGLLSAVEVILGPQKQAQALDLYLDQESLTQKFAQAQKQWLYPDQPLLVLTDLFGGSVNQALLKLVDLKQTLILTGVNLPLVLELLTTPAEQLTSDQIRTIVATNHQQIMVVNDLLQVASAGDDFGEDEDDSISTN
ncbi:hypothetical protein HU830_04260 [Lactobacillus sp. DCY120]|uniref:PTS EIIA type-4 domain-containing protein n=1 Tax=Bombilactobacillus apium TaxID=2675299 RepID=A0A850RAL0_9LACO|nr:hypothetical protein [Bombilactobacillus apium]NVY96386.1 hypothetical protein [Bombilactobacillus apium]